MIVSTASSSNKAFIKFNISIIIYISYFLSSGSSVYELFTYIVYIMKS